MAASGECHAGGFGGGAHMGGGFGGAHIGGFGGAHIGGFGGALSSAASAAPISAGALVPAISAALAALSLPALRAHHFAQARGHFGHDRHFARGRRFAPGFYDNDYGWRGYGYPVLHNLLLSGRAPTRVPTSVSIAGRSYPASEHRPRRDSRGAGGF